jgi:Tfp pilus assembly protein PilE
MENRQRGVTISGLIVWLVVFIVVALLAMKLIPSYMEFASARNAIQAIARERNTATPAEVRRAFDARAQIDDITVIKGSDLDVTKQGNDMVISFTYRKEVPLFANVGLVLDFAADTGQ